jgi:DnaJ-class molecular chaperone
MIKWQDKTFSFQGELKRLQGISPFALLGVSEQATESEVKAAYRRKVMAYHPDRADPFMRAHGEEVVKLLNTAYEKIRKQRGFDGT